MTIVTAACSTAAQSNRPDVAGTSAAANLAPAQMLPGGVAVSCGAGQQTLVKQTVVNGQPTLQVECVMAPATAPAYAIPTAQTWGPGAPLPVATVPVVAAPAQAYASPAVYRPVSNDEVVYQRPVRRVERRSGRTWQKSAIIIGSSAGIGAGVGAAVGGKKGALIGAALGGGSAAIWDQVTRRQ
jgi:hypothetical protein